MKITHYDDDTVTVQVDRGPEVYDPATGTLHSSETISADDFAKLVADAKKSPGTRPGQGSRGWLNEATLPAALRDLAHLGDSELDVAGPVLPTPFKALDTAAKSMEKRGTPGKARPKAKKPASDGPATGAAASPAIYESPEGSGSGIPGTPPAV